MTCPTFPCQIGRLLFYQSLCIHQPSLPFPLSFFAFCSISLPFFHLSFTFSLFLIAVSKKFQLDIRVVCVKELNFILHSEVFHALWQSAKGLSSYFGLHALLYKLLDSSSALTVDSTLFSYLDIWLPSFLPKGLTSREAKHLGP